MIITSLSPVIRLLTFLLLAVRLLAYDPPRGIKDPAGDFGYEIDRARPTFPAEWLAGTTSAKTDWYYIDNTDPAATNTSNPNGHPDVPRLDMAGLDMNNLAAGSVIYIHTGTYSRKQAAFNYLGTYQIGGAGTTTDPIWIMGGTSSPPVIARPLDIGNTQASNLIFDHINVGTEVDGATTWRGYFEIRPRGAGTHTADNIIIRHSTMTGAADGTDTSAVQIGSNGTGFGIRDYDTTNTVVYDCVCYNFGVWDSVAEQDVGMVYKSARTTNTYVLNSTCYHVGGDACGGSANGDFGEDLPTANYFIGGNTFYECGENAIDVKCVDGVVIASNDISGPMGEQQGGGVVLHTGGGAQYLVQNIAVLYNKFHHLSGGAYSGGTPGVGTSPGTAGQWFIGNEFYDMDSSIAVQADSQLGFCMRAESCLGVIYFIDNTMDDYEIGILCGGNSGETYSAAIHGNIFGDRNTYAGGLSNTNQEWIVTNSKAATADHNIYKGTPAFTYLNATRTFAYLTGAGLESGSLSATDPLFTNGASRDYTLQSGSPAKDSSTAATAAYSAFETEFGYALTTDRAGTTRPQNGIWDMGAYEYTTGGGGGGSTSIPTVTVTGTLTVGSP